MTKPDADNAVTMSMAPTVSSGPSRVARLLVKALEVTALPAALLAIWWVVSVSAENIFFPPVPDILSALWEWLPGALTTDVLASVRNVFIGYFVGAALAIVAGCLIGSFPTLHALTSPVIEFLRGLPPPALLPVFALIIGFSNTMRISIIAWAVAWPVLISTIDGVRQVDSRLHDVGDVFQVTGPRRLFWIVLPSASPSILAGMRTGLGIGLIMIVVSEMVSSGDGIGNFILTSANAFSFADSWAGTILMGLLGFVLSGAFAQLERYCLRWQERSGSTGTLTQASRKYRSGI